jgi:putative aldouronate transport system substrate-binding protein
MKRFKVLNLVLTITLIMAFVLTGCGQAAEKTGAEPTAAPAVEASSPEAAVAEAASTAAPAETGIDTSKEVKLYGYLLGAAPAGFDAVMAKLNEKLKADLNCSMEINYIGWSDMQSKYPLVLAAGENIDWIFTAPWSFYAQQAANGAFMEITEDVMTKYMPKHWAIMKETSAMNEAAIDGKAYMVTSISPDKKVNAFLYRKDLADKYGVAEINKLSDIEPYLKAIKENEKGMIPMNLESTYDLGRPINDLVAETLGQWKDPLVITGGGSGLLYKPFEAEIKLDYQSNGTGANPYFVTAAKKVKTWYDAGYINKNAFANKVRSKDAFVQGKSAVGFGNSMDLQGPMAQAEGAGFTVKIVPVLGAVSGKYAADPYINNGFAISAKSKNWERTLMAMDLICEDEAYEHLVYYGIDGVNYVIKDNKIDLPEGITADKNTYPADAAGFWFTNKNLHLPLATWTQSYIDLYNKIPEYLGTDPLAAYTPNVENIKTEAANCNAVLTQYQNPINLGAVKDVDAAYKQLDDKLKAAGIEKIYTEVEAQIKAYLGK